MIAFNDVTVNLFYEQFEVLSTKNFNGLPVFETGKVTNVSVKLKRWFLH